MGYPVSEQMSVAAPIAPTLENPLDGFIAVELGMLRRLQFTTVNLFVQYDAGSPLLLYRRANCELPPGQWQELLQTGVQRIYVRSDDFGCFGDHLLKSIELLGEAETVSQSERFAALQLALAGEIERTAHLMNCGPYVELSAQVSRDLTSLLVSYDVLPRDLFQLARHDFNTFTHVTNVSAYCVLLAKQLGICDVLELEQIAMGGMLHDIGKRFISAAILTKPSRLEPHERELICTHPQRGYEELCTRSDVTEGQLLMTYQHHERMDGQGYPVGITGREMHSWSKMIAIVDVFDAMTGIRPYRRSASSHEALSYIRQLAGTHFDREMVTCWTSAMSDN